MFEAMILFVMQWMPYMMLGGVIFFVGAFVIAMFGKLIMKMMGQTRSPSRV